ncbi:SDR family oxidoreductase [Streptomyces sp. RB6PN25]|uniref:SDR family oxidoreductase n=1 Tax=Streptomyces humicola TaxID=2953240 RepID=A0ABT1PSC2_9ACTN|nr:SDR family oxidoreductase [Streptomyces humicola]MCQ4080559.1 SDR family oxidoreductase [Streptomyces humicola]
MGRFDGYGVLVTGAGQGIGEAAARRFAGEGGSVLVTDIVPERADRVAEAIITSGGTAEPYACDVADQAAVDGAVAFAVERFGSLDVLVNNAYSCAADPERFEEFEDTAWYRDFEVTVHGTMRCSRAALPHLAAADGRGAIVNVGSVNSEAYHGCTAYSAAKAALVGFTRTLAVQAAPRGVRVNLVQPGTTHTAGWDQRGQSHVLAHLARHYPLGRVGTPEDMAAAITFLASRDASWITGVTLPVDGGLLVSNLGMNQAFDEDAVG